MAPRQKPGRSEQAVRTPPEFLAAVKNHLGIVHFDIDLAADADNKVAEAFYSEADDALADYNTWATAGWAWCNPPYSNVAPWVSKAVSESTQQHAHVAMLLPASVGSNWWHSYVHDIAYVTFLSPRLTFVGHTNAYPKDLALLIYAPYIAGGYATWRWK